LILDVAAETATHKAHLWDEDGFKFEVCSRIDGIGADVENPASIGAQFGRLPIWGAFQIGCEPI
jgi:hypothetical protein